MKTSKNQDITIDALLATHRELTAVDLCDYNISSRMAGGILLTIKSGEYWYMYKILSSGAITDKGRSDNNISFQNLKYFQD